MGNIYHWCKKKLIRMEAIANWLTRKEDIVSAKSFAAFRVLFSLLLLAYLKHLYFYYPLVFNNIPNIVYNPFPPKLFIAIWLVNVLLLLFGCFTKVSSIINYLFVVLATFLFSNSGTGSFNDDLLRIGSLLLIFMPVSRHYSLDALYKAVRYGITKPAPTSSLYYVAAIFISLGLMYFGAGICKVVSPLWLNGLGVWTPLVMPYNHWNTLDGWVDNVFIMKTLNYCTIVWEVTFVFVLFTKRIKYLFAITGVLFHLALAIIFPFPLLCFGPLPFYALFIPSSFWQNIKTKTTSVSFTPNNVKQQFFVRVYQSIFPQTILSEQHQNLMKINGLAFANNWQASIAALQQSYIGKLFGWILSLGFVKRVLDFLVEEVVRMDNYPPKPFISRYFKRYALLIFVLMLGCVQILYSAYRLRIPNKANAQKQMKEDTFYIRKSIYDGSLRPKSLFRTFFGINGRGVFLDRSFVGSKSVFAIAQVNKQNDTIWLPFFDEKGLAQEMNLNMAWAKYSFNSVCAGTAPNPAEIEKVIWHWLKKNNLLNKNHQFVVYKRTYVYPKAFEKGYLQKMSDLSWELLAEVSWSNGRSIYRKLSSEK